MQIAMFSDVAASLTHPGRRSPMRTREKVMEYTWAQQSNPDKTAIWYPIAISLFLVVLILWVD
jgi:hypothetical protein